MLELVGAKLFDIGGKLGIVAAELGELGAVMAVDLGFDRIGAGQRRLLGH